MLPLQRAAIAARIRGDVSRFSAVLFTAVAVVLVMACANLAGLILARTERRRREMVSVLRWVLRVDVLPSTS